tara:strand:- start:741 stop:1715 length:975 start_codon:yes stop_codon:yes gene_type:complete
MGSDSDSLLFQKLKQYRQYIFKSHAQYTLGAYLENWIKQIVYIRPNKPTKYTAVIIEDRPGELVRFSIYNTLLMSKLRLKIILFTTHDSFKRMQDIFSDLKHWVEVRELNSINKDIKKINTLNYNQILKSINFWEMLPTRNILIFQTDALLIEPIDFTMFNYDYIGSPFSNNKYLSTSFPQINETSNNDIVDKWVTQIFNKSVPIPDSVLLGNGGLSIRNRDVMIEICGNEYSTDIENEDIYFSRLIKSYSKNIVPFDVAKRFSCESAYFKSIGAHASYLYLTKEQQAEIYERHIKHVFALTDLSIDCDFFNEEIAEDDERQND